MYIRQVSINDSDLYSAKLFFQQLCSYYDFSKVKALDMFARTGALTVQNYYKAVKSLECWELNEEHKKTLITSFSPQRVKIGCSYKFLQECSEKYGLVVVDSPQGAHMDYQGNVHYEHFSVMTKITPILADSGVVVFYVNKQPYNKNLEGEYGYDVYREYDFGKWMECRRSVYGSAIITEEQAIEVYRLGFKSQGYDTEQVIISPCYSDVPGKKSYAFRLALCLCKSN